MKTEHDHTQMDPQTDEFCIDDASDLESSGMNRRGFLRALGISGIASLAACERMDIGRAIPMLIPAEELIPGTQVKYASTCTACPAACGLMVSVRDGRPVKLEGYKAHPLSKGGLCALGQADIRGLYDAGRLQSPTAEGESVTWDQLDVSVHSRLNGVRESGKSVNVVSSTIVSPTARQAIEDFLRPYNGRLVEYDAGIENTPAVRDAYRLLDGRAITPALAIDQADVLLVFRADLLGTGSDSVVHTMQYSDRRRNRKQGDDFRHIQVEANLSLTGAAADERILATTYQRRLMAFSVLKHVAGNASSDSATLARELVSTLPEPEGVVGRSAEIAQQLLHHKGRALVVSGSNDTAEQVAVALTNRILGAEGHTLNLELPSLIRRGDAALAGFMSDLRDSRVGAAFIVGQNPVEELPQGTEIKSLLGGLPLSVAITDRPNATTAACQFIAPSHHRLESWGDAAPRGDVLTIAQPTIRPIYDTRHPVENFLYWAGDETTDYHQYLVNSWRRNVFANATETTFPSLWNNAVSNGSVPADMALSSTFDDPASDRERPASARQRRTSLVELFNTVDSDAPIGLEVELLEEVGVRDGKPSFNPWMRELPDPLTRTSWIATVRMAPSLAKSKGISNGDVIELQVEDSSVRLPVLILPGQHPDVLGIPVGYGLRDGDGAEIDRNAFRLVQEHGGRFVTAGLPVALHLTGERHTLPLMQTHDETGGRDIIHQVSSPDEAVHTVSHGENTSLWETRKHSPHWDMVIDLDACTGCGGCVLACQAENNIPVVGPQDMADHRDMHWLRIDRYFEGDDDTPEVLFEPMMCAQCDYAPCETVCPVAATVHSQDGLNQQVYNRCVGTRYCANNCPYKVRRFNWFDYRPDDPVERMVLNPDVVVRERGIMEKCTFCVQRIQRARIDAKIDGTEDQPLTVETACQQSCPAKAISFGDGGQKGSTVAEAKESPRAFQVLAELGIAPSITYLARVRNRNGHSTNNSTDKGHT
jgi:Fe-S-cluster-containing dehydrogenase component